MPIDFKETSIPPGTYIDTTTDQTFSGKKTGIIITSEPFLDVRKHGVNVDNASDSTTMTANVVGMQAAIEAAGAAKGGIIIPGKVWLNDVLRPKHYGLQVTGVNRYQSQLVNATTDMWTWGKDSATNVGGLGFSHLGMTSANGHVFNVGATNYGASRTVWFDLLVVQNSPDKSVVNLPAGLYLDNLWFHCEINMAASATVPAFNLISAEGGLNANTWFRLRCLRSGAYFFYLENTDPSSYCNDNTFRDINFEETTGGNIKLMSANHCTIEQCNTYDLADIGSTTHDLFYLGGNTGPPSIDCSVVQASRRGGVLGAGLYDIKIVGGGRHEVRKCAGSHDFGDVTMSVFDDPSATYTGLAQTKFYGQKLVAAVPESVFTADYTLALGDADAVVAMNVATANTVTVPPDSSVNFPVGTTLEVYQHGAGQTAVAPGLGVTIRSDGAKLKIAGQYGSASLRKRAANDWVAAGDLAS